MHVKNVVRQENIAKFHQLKLNGLIDRNINQSPVQLREYYKDLEYRHHFLSKFCRSAFLILEPISYFLEFIWLIFLPKNYWSSLDHHDLMAKAVTK